MGAVEVAVAAKRLTVPPDRPAGWTFAVTVAALAVAALGGAIATVDARLTVLAAATALVAVAVVARPVNGAYLLIAGGPLVVGMERGTVFPVLRPNEVLILVVGLALLARGVVRHLAGRPFRPELRGLDRAVGLFVLAGTVLPLLTMWMRERAFTQVDVLYALVPVKYAVVYLVVSAVVRTEADVRRCLIVMLAASGLIAIAALLEVLQLFGVRDFLHRYYAGGDVLLGRRATSTIGHPIGLADVMVFNLAVASAWWARGGPRALLSGAAGIFALGLLASGQFSGLIALVVGATTVAIMTRRARAMMLGLVAVVLLGGLLLRPVLNERLASRSPGTGLPQSWETRRHNVERYVLPRLHTPANVLLGVRPAARASVHETINTEKDYAFIESGYLWLLWTGGLPLLVAYGVFVGTGLHRTASVARSRSDCVGAAAVAAFAALVVIALLTAFDPHLTLRGSADVLFPLLALAARSEGRPA